MKRKLLKVFAFLLGLIFLLVVSSQIVVPKNNDEKSGMEDLPANGLLAEKENTIDVLFLGNSVAYAGFYPLQIWEEYGYTSYVRATTGQPVIDSLYYEYQTYKTQTPKVVILEANNMFLRTPLTSPFKRVLNEYLPVFKYHNRWKNLNLDDFYKSIEYTHIDDLKGHGFSKKVKGIDPNDYMAYTDEKEIVSESNKIYVRLMKWLCEKHNTKLVLMGLPSIDNWNYKRHNAIEEFAKEEGLEFYDLNLEDIGIDWNNDTRDTGDHLNFFGVEKVNRYVGKLLNDMNILEDHRDDDNYKDWDIALEKAKEIVK